MTNNLTMKVLLLLTLASPLLCNKAESILRSKLKATVPSTCPAAGGLYTNIQKQAKNYLVSITTQMLEKYISKSDTIIYNRGGHSQTFNYKPYGNFASLKYGEKYESSEEDVEIIAGQVSFYTSRAYTGYRKGYNVEIASVLAVSSINALQKYGGRECAKYTGMRQARKCVEFRNINPRSFTLEEIKKLEATIRCTAIKEAISKMPTSLSSTYGFEAINPEIEQIDKDQIYIPLLGKSSKKFKQSLTNVDKKNVVDAIGKMVRGNVSNWKTKINSIVNANKSGTVNISMNGNWKVSIKKSGSKFNLSLNK